MREQLFETETIIKDAEISRCGQYRYWLSRIWDRDKPFCTWIMLNPSTADASVDDPTIRRCINFTRQWEYGGLYVVNLFAFRATDPKHLKQFNKPVVDENWINIMHYATMAGKVVVAWGNHGGYLKASEITITLLSRNKITPYCLGVTSIGQPKHPLYIKSDTKPTLFTRTAAEQAGGEG